MRQITEEITKAFFNGQAKKISNSETNGTSLYLWDNEIARKEDGQIKINLCGYNTTTTRERLNGVLSYTGYKVTTKQGTIYLVDRENNKKEIPSDEWVTIGK